jgi:ketosteroid isomerase-like protein
MSTANDPIAWAKHLYATGVDRKDADAFAAAFTDDAWLRFGNNARLEGREAIREGIAGFFQAMRALRHEFVHGWVAGDTLINEAVVTYTRHDGAEVSVPAVTIFRLVPPPRRVGGVMADQCRIYVDLAPLFAPAAP